GTVITDTFTTYTHIYKDTGAYLPFVIFSDGQNCTTNPSFGLDTIKVDKIYADFSWSVPCAGTAFNLTQQSSAMYNPPTSWSWYFSGGGDTAAGPTASYTYATGGTH